MNSKVYGGYQNSPPGYGSDPQDQWWIKEGGGGRWDGRP